MAPELREKQGAGGRRRGRRGGGGGTRFLQPAGTAAAGDEGCIGGGCVVQGSKEGEKKGRREGEIR